MTAPLPARWDDEPWPLDDPVPAPGLRPTNWSDTHTNPPQVADLADEAWQRAVDRGISMERALAELQREAQYHQEFDRQIIHGSTYRSAMGFATGGPVKIATWVPVTGSMVDLSGLIASATVTIVGEDETQADDFPDLQAAVDRRIGDLALADVKRAPIVPSYKWEPNQ